MTIQPPFPTGDLHEAAPPPDRRPVITVPTYAEAVRAVDALAAEHFPVEHVAIVGRGVRTIEDVTGPGGTGRAVGSAVFAGGLIGLFFGVLFDWWGAVEPAVDWGWLALYGLVYGAFAGLVVALILRAAGSRHDFASVRTLEAEAYDITLTGGERAEALRVLHGAGLA